MCVCMCVRVCLHTSVEETGRKTLTSVNTTAAVAKGVICYHSPPLKHPISKQAEKMPRADKPLRIPQGVQLPLQSSIPPQVLLKYCAKHLSAVDF